MIRALYWKWTCPDCEVEGVPLTLTGQAVFVGRISIVHKHTIHIGVAVAIHFP